MSVFMIANERGKYHDIGARQDLIRYIWRPDKVVHGYIGGIHVDPNNPAGSMDQVAAQFGKEKGVQLRHWILSFEPEEQVSLEVANQIAMGIIAFFGTEYQAVYAVHEDKPHLHIHVVSNSISYVDGHRYQGKHEEFHRFERHLKHLLRPYKIYTRYSAT